LSEGMKCFFFFDEHDKRYMTIIGYCYIWSICNKYMLIELYELSKSPVLKKYKQS